jgi:hypothetical protein
VQQVTVDVKQIGIVADATDDVLVPDFGQQGSARRLHCRILPFFLLLWQVDAPPSAALHGLSFRSLPERAHQNIPETSGQRLIWWARPHARAERRRIEAAFPNAVHFPAGIVAAFSGSLDGTDFALCIVRIMPASRRRAAKGDKNDSSGND